MLRGIGIAAAQLIALGLNLKTIAANMANSDTPGYRQDVVSEQDFSQLLLQRLDRQSQLPNQQYNQLGALDLGPLVSRPTLDLTPGPIDPTGRPLDVAMTGQGFFVVQAPDGARYTRRGAFHQNGTGQLVSLEGWPVLGQKGPVASTGPLMVAPNGDVTANGQVVDRLQLVTFPAGTAFNRREGTYVVPDNGATASSVTAAQLLPGNLEGSNVDLTTAMTDMLTATRMYEAAQKAVVTQDSALAQLIQQTNGR